MCKRVLFLVVVAGLLSSSAFAADPNLFLHFELDEGAGTTVGSTVPSGSNSVSGMIGLNGGTNYPLWENAVGSIADPNGYLREDFGTCLYYPEASHGLYTYFAPNDVFDNFDRAISFSYWQKIAQEHFGSTYGRVVRKESQYQFGIHPMSSTNSYEMCFRLFHNDGSGTTQYWSGWTPRLSVSELPVGQWNHIVFTCDLDTTPARKIYCNGIVARTNTDMDGLTGPMHISSDEPLRLNTSIDWATNPGGWFDDYRLYNRGLLPGEIKRFWGTGANVALAYEPCPVDGTSDLSLVGIELTWNKGDYATTHKIFYGKDFDDVNTAVAGAAPAGVTEVDRALGSELVALGTLDLTTTYYWRVDEGNSVTTWDKGPVWNFSTTNNALVENFEAYVIDANLWKVWIDSWPSHGATYNDSGSTIRMEATEVNNGSGAMEFIYDNSDDWNYGTDHYSETEGSTSAMVSEGSNFVDDDFAYQGCKALDLWYKGDAGNAAQQMYIGFTDGTNTAVKVLKVYDRSGLPTAVADVNAVKNSDWTRWQVDLVNNMNSVNTSAITKVYLGTGVRGQTSGNPAGMVGTVYFDDLGLFQPRCYAQYVGTDFTGDCITDENDLSVMTGEWLNVAQTVNMPAPSAPTTGPILHYTFDNNDLTNSGTTGSAHDMNSEPNSFSFVAGKVGASALHLNGIENTQVWIDDVNVINVDDITLSYWYKWEGVSDRIIRKMTWDSTGRGISIRPMDGRWYCYVGDGSVYNRIAVRWVFDEDPAYSEWTHAVWTMARDVNGIATSKFYCDGSDVEQDQWYASSGNMEFDTATYDWKNSDQKLEIGDDKNVSSFDDFRVYDYALTYAQARSVYGATQADSVIRGPASISGGNAVTNLYDAEVDQTINFKDFAELGKEWMEEDLWPFAGCAE